MNVGEDVRPKRIWRRRTNGWRMPPNTVCVTRPGPWGNLFSVLYRVEQMHMTRQDAQADAVKKFSDCIHGMDEANDSEKQDQIEWIKANIDRLRGRNLACWCKPGTPCHGDVLLELANR